jgi:sterol desaturase/sphingolipid hydroxylase (fatty acid hydroxylase superfamily)
VFASISPVIGAFVFAAAVSVAELVAPIERPSLATRIRGTGFMLIGVVLGLIVLRGFQFLWEMIEVRPLLTVPAIGTVPAVVLGILLYDFIGYWNHRFQHRFLWPIHAVHHSPTELCAATNYGHFLEKPFRFVVTGIPLSLIDFQLAATPFVIVIVREMLEYYIHSPTTAHFGPLAKVIVDNRVHRVHHSMEPRHFDKNFGVLVTVWDRLFGTYCKPDNWPAVGIAGHPPARSIVDFLLYPLRYRSSRNVPPKRVL